jgi:hypothetical protein
VSDLLEFIEARLTEDEQTAFAAIAEVEQGASWLAITDDVWKRAVFDADRIADHMARHDPARVLRDVEATRAVLRMREAMALGLEAADGTLLAGAARVRLGAYDNVLQALATAWSDHEAYRSEWAP